MDKIPGQLPISILQNNFYQLTIIFFIVINGISRKNGKQKISCLKFNVPEDMSITDKYIIHNIYVPFLVNNNSCINFF